ncbi:hypothetical protein [Bradyrhizobium sp. Arg816]|uniref:hypothetical protein n=1 Tax=Bradyrhizobium sp. Arg816 TaxID=2998491 RepID=UPI00249F0286|nr:hypothetical protein [Bradyrhizobium sp. Arg816]MDI3560219.1 hypothetical protein [Bradyrhizobium sp. Arg816]
MNRAIAIACLVVALAGFGWAYERVNSISSRLNLLADMVSLQNDRIQVRTFAIKSQIAQATQPIVFVGDSLTEGAWLPSALCGHLANAGIGGATAVSYAKVVKGFSASYFLSSWRSAPMTLSPSIRHLSLTIATYLTRSQPENSFWSGYHQLRGEQKLPLNVAFHLSA